jgi:rhamnosyltransferase
LSPGPRVSLAIPTWNAGPLLAEVLAAVDSQPGAGELERIAIDSGSTDGTVDLLRRHGFAVEGIDQADFDHGAVRDRMIARAEGEIVVLLTQDATPADARWLPALRACYEDPQVGAAYCRQIPRPDCNPFIARRLREWTAGKTERAIQEPCTEAGFAALEPMQRLRRCAYDNVAGSVRRSAWQAVGGFGRRPFGEDVAFGRKLILAGFRIAFEPDSAVVHSHNRSPRAEGQRIYCDHQNLRDLFGLQLLPDYAAYLGAVRWGETEYARIVDELGLPPGEAADLQAWARGYAGWAALGMFLGAASRANMSGPGGTLFRALDAVMHAGI